MAFPEGFEVPQDQGALVEVNLSAASAEIRQNLKTTIGTHFRASVKPRLFFFTVMLVQQT